MKVILNRDVPNLGEEGDICEVARGYARNYLIPRNMVLMYNRQNIAAIESRRTAIEQRKADKRKEASSIKERIESEELVVRMAAGERGKLFGSVTTAAIVEELEKRGIQVERRRIDIPEGTIKSLGAHTVRVRLYGDEEASLTVRVESEAPEAEAAAATRAAPEPVKTAADGDTASGTDEAVAAEESAVAGQETTAEESDSQEESVETGADTEDEPESDSAAAAAEQDNDKAEA